MPEFSELLSKKLTSKENSPFETIEPQEKSTAIGGQLKVGSSWTTQGKR